MELNLTVKYVQVIEIRGLGIKDFLIDVIRSCRGCLFFPSYIQLSERIRLKKSSLNTFLFYKNELQLYVDGGRSCFPYLVYLLLLSVSAKRMKFIYEMRLHPEMNRTMENDWQFSNHLCQTSSKSTQVTNMKHAKNSSRLRSSVSTPHVCHKF